MDPGGPGSRTGRTFWTFWNYITDIVGRFLRAEPPGTEKNATNNVNSTPTNDELLDSHHKDNATEEREEVHVDPAFSVGSTRPVVLWDTGSELQPEMRQNIEQDEMNENDDGKKDKEIETGNDVVTYLPISSTTIDNPEQSSDVIRNDEELMPKILVDSQDEMINIDMKVSKQYCSEEANKPQSKEQLNAISKEGFNEQNTYSAVEPELTSEDTKTVKQTCCEQHDGKLLLSDNMDLEECVSIIEKQEHVEADGNEESASVKSDRDGNKNAMEGTAEIKNMTDEDRYRETMCYDVLQNTHLELTQQNTCMIEVTHTSDEGLNRMNTEDMKKPHSLVLETENLCKQDDISESYEEDVVMMQNNPDIENLEKLSDMESLMSDNTCVVVESEDDEKETEFQKEEIEMMENDDDTMTNQNAAFDLVDGNNAKETCPALIIDKDITQTYTLEETDGESSTEESTDMNKDDLNKLHSSMVLETENMSKQDDKNEVHDENKDDKVLTQNNLDIENLERSSDMESLMSDNTYVTVLEEKESHVKQELTVAITADDSVKSEDAEKESEIQKEEIEMMENDNDDVTNTNASFDSEDGNNSVIDQDMIQTCTLEETDGESSTEESTDMNKDDLKRQDNRQEIEIMENDDDTMTNQNAAFDLVDGNNAKETCPALIIDKDITQTYTLEVTDGESSTEESTDMNKDDLKRQDNRQEIEIMENDDDTMTNQNAAFDLVDGNNAKETCPALIIDKDITQTYTLEVTDGESSTEESTDMNKDDLNKLHSSMVLETENMSKQDDKNEVHDENKDDKVLTQNNLDIENLERSSDMESLMSDHTYVIVLEEKESRVKQELTVAITADDSVKLEDAEKESEIQKEEIEMMENDDVTNTNAPFDSEDGNNTVIDQDMIQTCTLEETDGESSTEESTDMNKDDLNKLHSSMVLETENMSKQDDKNEVHDENKDDKVLTLNNLDIENLERSSDMESLMPDHTYVIVLEEKESRVKQELTVANTTDDSGNVKSENSEKENEIQTEQSEMTEYDDDSMTSQNAELDSEDGNNAKETCPEPIVDLPFTTDVKSITEESKDLNKDSIKLHTFFG
ncbi:protein PFC0760c-like [Periophthalmus magnuspinnatus]|uniref:protein PFC0760c-like n=1 Tax=Periophthalmus magnuspinnatus TaxID=409849 RepID=UPI002436B059|nr:protein PFC0760c-like [Periophthalmus magnuspinnatus]